MNSTHILPADVLARISLNSSSLNEYHKTLVLLETVINALKKERVEHICSLIQKNTHILFEKVYLCAFPDEVSVRKEEEGQWEEEDYGEKLDEIINKHRSISNKHYKPCELCIKTNQFFEAYNIQVNLIYSVFKNDTTLVLNSIAKCQTYMGTQNESPEVSEPVCLRTLVKTCENIVKQISEYLCFIEDPFYFADYFEFMTTLQTAVEQLKEHISKFLI